MPKRSATPSSVASQLYEAGSVGEVNATGLGLIGLLRRGVVREADLDRVAVGQEALGLGQRADRRAEAARPSRVIRWTWLNLPKVSTASGPQARARPPVGRTWFAPEA